MGQLRALDPKAAQDLLIQHYPWSPHDFVRAAGFFEADRAIYIESLTRALPPQDDLRFLYHLPAEHTDVAIFGERLSWDTDFFGYPVARLNTIAPLSEPMDRPAADYTEVVRAFSAEASNRGIKYLLARVDGRELSIIRALGAAGFELIETRICLERELNSFTYPRRFPWREARRDEVDRLGLIAQRAINRYDRFHADPFIDVEKADRMMYKWIEASILGSFSDIVFVPDVAEPKAVGTVKYHRGLWNRWGVKLAQPTMIAVMPEATGWGLRLLTESLYHLRDLGAERCFVLTQIANVPMYNLASKLGFTLAKGGYIFRKIL